MEEQDLSKLIANLKNMLNNTNSTNSESSSSNSKLNITPEMISNIANSINKSNTSSDSANSSIDYETTNSSNIDLVTILKVKNIIEALNKKDDARSNLLYSLKPYLRESRKQKVDQYVNLFKLSGLTDLLKKEKGDSD